MNNIVKMQSNYSSTSSKYHMHQEFLPYYMPDPYYSNISAINNVTVFNNYIFERVPDKDIKKQGDKAKSDDSINMIYCESAHPNQNDNLFAKMYEKMYNISSTYIPWMKDTCFIYLIGTPEDIEELIMLPGIIVRAAYDETWNFITEMFFKGDSCSTLHTKDQQIKYRLDSYYEAMPTWYNDYNGYGLLPTNSEGNIIELLDQPYSECPEFKDPKRLNTINPVCIHHINPDERVYKIYIQMSADLIRTAYERSNFFIDIRNTKKKMSIKNFIEYLS